MTRLLVFTLALVPTMAIAAYCPSYTLSSPENTGNCSTEAATGPNPTIDEWNALFEVLSGEEGAWPVQAPSLGTIGQGCNLPMAPRQVPAKVPCEMFKAMAMQESLWQQFCVPTQPADQTGKPAQTIIAKDCGYGVMQVTSGMRQGETPNYTPARVASETFYNMAIGANILMQKWRVTKCVGDNQPQVLENWYTAVWAYNGLSYKNNPANPVHSSARGVWNPQVRGSAPYQEKVYGWLQYPPTPNHWEKLELAYPLLSEVGSAGAPDKLSEPACASPTDCSQTRASHVSSCGQSQEVTDAGVPDAGEPETSDGGEPETTDAGNSNITETQPPTQLVETPEQWRSATPFGCAAGGNSATGSSLWFFLLMALSFRAPAEKRKQEMPWLVKANESVGGCPDGA